MKARHHSLHDKGGQLRVGKDGDAHKLDDVRMSKGAHQLALTHETGGGFFDIGGRDRVIAEKIVDGFGGADGSSYDHLLHISVGSGADFRVCLLYVGK